jgi:hypothetical protein
VLSRLQQDATSGYGVSWGADLTELTLRHGWPLTWAKYPARARVAGRRSSKRTAVYRRPNISLLPKLRYVLDPSSIRPGEWSLRPSIRSESYSPTYLSTFNELEHQVAVFRRDDSAVVVAAYDQRRDESWPSGPAEAALLLAREPSTPPLILRETRPGPHGVLRARFASGPVLMSLELVSNDGRHAARARYGLRPTVPAPTVASLSDLLLLDADGPPPRDLDGAIPRARGSLRARPGERLAAYWEVYDLGPDAETLSLTLTLHRVRGDPRLHEVPRQELYESSALELRWREVVPAHNPLWGRSVNLDLPDALPPGLYLLQLIVRPRTRGTMRQARVILVRDRYRPGIFIQPPPAAPSTATDPSPGGSPRFAGDSGRSPEAPVLEAFFE